MAESQAPSENKALTSIRGVAALWVVLHHWVGDLGVSADEIRYGMRSVDIFFVLSGLILAEVYYRIDFRSVGGFFLKRFFRIYPAYWFSMALLGFVALFPHRMTWAGFTSLWNWNYVELLMLLQPYIKITAGANPVAWSLGIELTCYLAFPLAMMAFRNLKPYLLIPLLIFAAWFEVYYVLVVCTAETSGMGALGRGLGGFGFGMLVLCFARTWNPGKIAIHVVEGIATMGILYAVFNPYPNHAPFWAAVIMYCLYFKVGVLSRILETPVLYWLGRISFSMYLIHFPLICAMKSWGPVKYFRWTNNYVGMRSVGVSLLILFLLSTLSLHLIEEPGRRIPAHLGAMMRRFKKGAQAESRSQN